MRSRTYARTGTTPSPAPTSRGLLVAYLLIPLSVLVLWTASEPHLAAALAAGAIGAVAIEVGLLYAATTLRGTRRRRVCIPRTGVCVEF